MAATTIKGFDIDGATRQIDYEALANKPTIPTTVAELIDASNYVTSAYVESMISASTEIPFFCPLEELQNALGSNNNLFRDIFAMCDAANGGDITVTSATSASVLTFFNIWKDAPSFYRCCPPENPYYMLYGFGGSIDVHKVQTLNEDEATYEIHYFSLNGLLRILRLMGFSPIGNYNYEGITIGKDEGAEELYVTGNTHSSNIYSSGNDASAFDSTLPITSIALQSALTTSNVISAADYEKLKGYGYKLISYYKASGETLMEISKADYEFLYGLPKIFMPENFFTFIPFFNATTTNSNSKIVINRINTSYILAPGYTSGYQFGDITYIKISSGSSFSYLLEMDLADNRNNIIRATKNSDYSLSLDKPLEIGNYKIPVFPLIKHEGEYEEQPYMWKENNINYFSLNGISYRYYAADASAVPFQSSAAHPLLNYTFTLNTGGTFDAPDSGIINDIIFKAINPSKSNLMIKVVSGSSAYWFNSFGYDSGTGIISCDTYVPNLSSNLALNIDSAGTGTLTMTQEKKHTQTITLNGGTVDLSCGDNVTYVASDLVSACTITCEQTPKTDGIENVVIFKTSGVTPSITISGGNCTMVWANNDVPSFKASKIYEVRATINDLGGTKYCMLAYAEYKAS